MHPRILKTLMLLEVFCFFFLGGGGGLVWVSHDGDLHETDLERLLVVFIDPVDVVEREVDMVYPYDSIELLDCLDHMKQVSVLLLSLASVVSSVDSQISMTVSYMVLLHS